MMFNELSIAPAADKYTANGRLIVFAEAVGEARKRGFTHIRSHCATNQIALAEGYTLFDWLNSKDVPKNYRDYMYGVIILPFIKEGDVEVEEQYVEANYYFEDKEAGTGKIACLGLASAYLYETLSISLPTLPVWERHKLPVIIEKAAQASLASVYNIFSTASLNVPEIVDFVERAKEVTLTETSIPPSEKIIHLSDHHGVKELQEMCNLLKNCPYVEEMRSTHWGGNRFIRRVDKTGFVEIVLFKMKRRYALLVKTTGRNLRETKKIANILDEQYS